MTKRIDFWTASRQGYEPIRCSSKELAFQSITISCGSEITQIEMIRSDKDSNESNKNASVNNVYGRMGRDRVFVGTVSKQYILIHNDLQEMRRKS